METAVGTTTTLQYFHPDHLSARVTTDANGNMIGQQGHFPFGESWYAANTTTKYQFTSYERDAESGNDYAQARYHINRLGRFASPDPVGGSIADPQSLNRYSYVGNVPISFEDPSGMAKCGVAFYLHHDGTFDAKTSGPWAGDDGVDDSMMDVFEPQQGCGGSPDCTVILDGTTVPCTLAYGGGGDGGPLGIGNDANLYINCPNYNSFNPGGCAGLVLSQDAQGNYVASGFHGLLERWGTPNSMQSAAVWTYGELDSGTVMTSCFSANACAMSYFFPQVSSPNPPSGGGGSEFTPEQGLAAVAQGMNMAAHAIPTICGGGVFAYAGAEGEKSGAEGFVGGLAEYDTQEGGSLSGLAEAAKEEGPGGGAFANKGGVSPLAFVPLTDVGGVVAFKSGAGLYAGSAVGHFGFGIGAYANVTSVAGCHE